MTELALGIVAAAAASTLYSLGVAYQATEAKQAPEEQHLRVTLVLRLLRRARWLAGTGMSMLGFPFQVIALLLAPLVVVQPTLAAGLIVLVFAAQRILGEHAGRREHLAMLVIVAGVVGIAASAPARTTSHSGRLDVTLVLVGLGVLSMAPYIMSMLGRRSASVTMVGAGLAFAWSGVATKLAADDIHLGHIVVAALWIVSTAGADGVGVLSEMSALQERPAILVAPVVFVTQTVVPVLLGPLLFGESFASTPANGVPLVISLVVLIAAAASLARSPLLLALMEGELVSDESDSTRSPDDASQVTMRSMPDADAADPSAVITRMSPARTTR